MLTTTTPTYVLSRCTPYFEQPLLVYQDPIVTVEMCSVKRSVVSWCRMKFKFAVVSYEVLLSDVCRTKFFCWITPSQLHVAAEIKDYFLLQNWIFQCLPMSSMCFMTTFHFLVLFMLSCVLIQALALPKCCAWSYFRIESSDVFHVFHDDIPIYSCLHA